MSSHRAPEESELDAVSLAHYRTIASIGDGSFEIFESVVYEGEFKKEFNGTSKDSPGRFETPADGA